MRVCWSPSETARSFWVGEPDDEAASSMSHTRWRFEPGDKNGKLAENCERLMSAFVERGYISEVLAQHARMEP